MSKTLAGSSGFTHEGETSQAAKGVKLRARSVMSASFQCWRIPLALALVVTPLLSACSSDGGSTSSTSSGQTTACDADTRKDVYTSGLTKTAGTYQVKLLEAKPGPPQKGTNELMLEVMDASNNPVDGATLTVTPFMPDHGHGSAVVPVVSALGSGKYSVTKVYLAMAGLWKLTVSVQMPGGAMQETAFQFCLDG